ncbi:MAG: hypothetical protein C4K47_09890 [Candidatus Thorarchaeota archaeon]|nr:MAG: hypothetical protein C4K47_09890 [Candidatus Thorarchaeota archaeon]
MVSTYEDYEMPSVPRRGTALLLGTIIVVAAFTLAYLAPGGIGPSGKSVRVAVIDSGMNTNGILWNKLAAAKSFVDKAYGYPSTDNSTEDSAPHGYLHGSYVAKIIVENAPNALVVNAKVVDANNTALELAIVAAIHWAVVEEDCTIINLSLGSLASNHDILSDAVKWAFERGVTVVAAAGNNGQAGVAGSSVESPAAYVQAIAVGAVDEHGFPYPFSACGPLRNGSLKPDISADGWYADRETSATVLGTSFAAPRVTAAVVTLIAHCKENGWESTPGMIKATLIASAHYLPSDSWEVGAGYLDTYSAVMYLDAAPKSDSLPLAVCVLPGIRPYSFERWFVNSTSFVDFSVFASNSATFSLVYGGSAAPWVTGPDSIVVNQTSSFSLKVCVVSNISVRNLRASITLVAPEYVTITAQLKFNASVGLAIVAFDTSHSPWWTDSIYGQYREFYELLTRLGIAVEEITDPESLQLNTMLRYDAIVILDPCSWDYFTVNGSPVNAGSTRYSQDDIESYTSYWEAGGGILVVGQQNSSIDVEGANQLLSAFNVSMNYDSMPPITIVVNGIASTIAVTRLVAHNVTQGVESFDYNGCSLNFSGACFELAWTEVTWTDMEGIPHNENKTVVVGLEGESGNRLVVVGSNYPFDNWGISGLYTSTQNSKLALQAILWLTNLTWP